MDDEERAVRFELALRSLFPRWRACAGLQQGRVPQLINSQGAVGAAKHLLRSHELSNGFIRLRDSGRLDATIEYLVVVPGVNETCRVDAVRRRSRRLSS